MHPFDAARLCACCVQTDRFIVVSTLKRSFVFNACRCSLQAPLPFKSSGVGVVAYIGVASSSHRIDDATQHDSRFFFVFHRCSLNCFLYLYSINNNNNDDDEATAHSGAVSGRDLCENNCYLSDECAMYVKSSTHQYVCTFICIFVRTSSRLSILVPARNAPGSLSLYALVFIHTRNVHANVRPCVRVCMYVHTYHADVCTCALVRVRIRSFAICAFCLGFIVIFTLPLDSLLLLLLSFLLTLFVDVVGDAYSSCNLAL